MAGDWIPWVKGLIRKREIRILARRFAWTGDAELDGRLAAAACMELWEWADSETTDGFLPGAHPADIDAVTHIPGFGAALAEPEIGWILADAAGLILPNWERWNSASAKRRLQTAQRVARFRRRADP